MRILKFWLTIGLGIFTPPLIGIPAVQAQQSQAQLRDVSRAELLHGISLTMQRLKPLVALAQITHREGVQAWYLGGASASIAFYAKKQLQRSGQIPADIHFFDVFAPGQDVDIAIDGDLAAVLRVQAEIYDHPYLQGKISEKRIWDLLTLREHNGRGIIDSRDMSLQHSDTMSLGLIKLESTPQAQATLRWALDFENTDLNVNPFLDSVMHERIDFIFRDTHQLNSQFRAGKNPAVLSVLRLINKAARYSLAIRPADLEKMQSIVTDFLATNQDLHDYVPGRINRIVRTMLLGARDFKYTRQLLRQFKVLKIMKQAGVPAEEIQEVILLSRQMTRSETGFFLGDYERVPVQRVRAMPDGAIFEGTTLFGGDRPPALLWPSRLKNLEEVQAAANLWANRYETSSDDVARELSNLAYHLADDDDTWTKYSPIQFLSDLPYDCRDCRDFSLMGHMLYTLAGIPSLISSTDSYTKIYIEIGDDKYLLNTHNGTAKRVEKNTATYFQNIWIRQGQDYALSSSRVADLGFAKHFEEHIGDPSVRFQPDELREYFVRHPNRIALFAQTQAKNIRNEKSVAQALAAYTYAEVLGKNFAPIARAAMKIFESSKVKGMSDSEYSALVTYFKNSAGVEIPEGEPALLVIDAFVDAMKKNQMSKEDIASLSLQILNRIQGWQSLENHYLVLTMLAGGISFDDYDVRNSETINRLRKPSLELVPLARHLWLSRNVKLFKSETMADYRDIHEPKLFGEMLKFDEALDSRDHSSLDEGRQFLMELLQRAEGGEFTARENLRQLVEQIGINRPSGINVNDTDDVTALVRKIGFSSPLVDVEPMRTLIKNVSAKNPDFFRESLEKFEPAASFERISWLVDFSDSPSAPRESRDWNWGNLSGLVLRRAFADAGEDEGRLKRYLDQLAPHFTLKRLDSDDALIQFLLANRGAQLKRLNRGIAGKLLHAVADVDDIYQKYSVIRDLVATHGPDLPGQDGISGDGFMHLLIDFAKLEAAGRVEEFSFNRMLVDVADEIGREDLTNSRFWTLFSPDLLRHADTAFVRETFQQVFLNDSNHLSMLLFIKKFLHHPYLLSDDFAWDITHDGNFPTIIHAQSRRAAQLLKVLLDKYAHDRVLPPFVMKLIYSGRMLVGPASPLFLERYAQLTTIAKQQLLAMPAGVTHSLSSSVVRKKLCEKYLHQLL